MWCRDIIIKDLQLHCIMMIFSMNHDKLNSRNIILFQFTHWSCHLLSLRQTLVKLC